MISTTADGTKDGFQLAREASASGAVAVVVDGVASDLAHVPGPGRVEIVAQTDELGREIVRHSTAHIMAQAVLNLYPGARYAIGPPIEDGFYYDFDVDSPFTPDDVARIESEMQRIARAVSGPAVQEGDHRWRCRRGGRAGAARSNRGGHIGLPQPRSGQRRSRVC
jgi:threonyl-tRNA synthetase